jgi:hypothetical protein
MPALRRHGHLLQIAQRLDAALHRHDQVEQQNVGPQIGDHANRFTTVARLADDAHIRIRFEQVAQRLAEQRVIVREEHAHRSRGVRIGVRRHRLSSMLRSVD